MFYGERAIAINIFLRRAIMQKRIGVLLVAVALLAGGQAFAGPDDAKWINKCIADNANEGAKPCLLQELASQLSQLLQVASRTHNTSSVPSS